MIDKINNIIEIEYNEDALAYTFIKTGVNVYSIEECLYHIKNNILDTFNDLLEDNFANWVKSEVKNIYAYEYLSKANRTSISTFVADFLSKFDYLDYEEIKVIKMLLSEYENSNEIKKFIDEINFKLETNDYKKAYNICKEYLNDFGESEIILNNISVICNKLGNSNEAIYYLLKLNDLDNNNMTYKLNLATSNLHVDSEKCKAVLQEIDLEKLSIEQKAVYYYLQGMVSGIKEGLDYFEKAYELYNTPEFLMNYINSLNANEEYIKVLKILDEKNETKFYLKASETLVLMNEVHKAIEFLTEITEDNADDIYLLSELMYLNAKVEQFEIAEQLAKRVLEIDINLKNNFVAYKFAKYNKLKGEIKTYNGICKNLIYTLKNDYIKNNII